MSAKIGPEHKEIVGIHIHHWWHPYKGRFMFFSLTVFLPLMHFRLDVRLNNKTGCSIPLHPAAKIVFSFLPQLTRRLEGGTNGSPKKFHFPNHYFLLLMYYCVAAGNESCAHTAVWFVSFSNKEIDPSIYKYTQTHTHTHTLFRRSGFSPSRRIFSAFLPLFTRGGKCASSFCVHFSSQWRGTLCVCSFLLFLLLISLLFCFFLLLFLSVWCLLDMLLLLLPLVVLFSPASIRPR